MMRTLDIFCTFAKAMNVKLNCYKMDVNFYCTKYGISKLFHITHINNLLSICELGLLSRNILIDNSISFYDISLKTVNQRRSVSEPIFNQSIHDYVPLFFNPKNPMLSYLIHTVQLKQNLVVLEVSTDVFKKEHTIFTDGNAAVRSTSTYTSKTRFFADLFHLGDLNWKVINKEGWNVSNDEKNNKSAEVLVFNTVETKYISKIYINSMTANEQENMSIFDKLQQKYAISTELSEKIFFLTDEEREAAIDSLDF